METVFLALLLLAPLSTDPWGSMIPLAKILHISIFACLLLGAFLFRPLFKCGFRYAPSWVDLLWLLFLAFGCLSLVWSINAPVHLQRCLLLVSVTVPFLWIRVRLAEGGRILPYIMILLAVGMLVAFIDSIGLLIEGSGGGAVANEMGEAQAFKTDSILFPHQNVASIYSVLLFPLTLVALIYSTSKRVRIFCGACMLALIVYMVLLKSRAALAESCFGLVVIGAGLWLQAKKTAWFQKVVAYLNTWPVLLCLGVVILGAFLLPLHKDFSGFAKGRFVEFVDFFGLDYQRAFFRVDIWRKTTAMIEDHLWLGVGLGNFSVVFPAYHKLEILKPHPHSEYFNVLTELGVVGMMIYASFLVLLLKAFLNCLIHSRGRNRILSLGLGCALLMGGLHGFVEPLMIFGASALNLLFCSGLLVHLEREALGSRVMEVGRGGAVRRFVLPPLVLAGLVVVLPKFTLAFANGLLLERAQNAVKSKDFSEAEQLYRKVLRRSWDSYFLRLRLGDTCLRQGEERAARAKELAALGKKEDARETSEEARRFFQNACDEYSRAESLFPYYFEIYFKKAVALGYLKRYEEAVAALTRCLSYNQRCQDAKVEKIRMLFQMERFDESFRYLSSYLRSKIRPTLYDLWKAGDMYERASCHKDRDEKRKLKDLKNAVKCFEKCLRIEGAAEKLPKLAPTIKRIQYRIKQLEKKLAVKS